MLDKFVPDMYLKSVYDIDYAKLKKKGIKCIIFDLDNTLSAVNVDKPTKKIKDLIEDIKELNLRVLIVSNSPKKRVEPFKEGLNVDSAYFACKPLSIKYKKIMNMYKLKPTEIACVGDQLLTDIFGANRLDLLSILVNPIGNTDFTITKFNRSIEAFIYKKLEKKELLKKGKYYE